MWTAMKKIFLTRITKKQPCLVGLEFCIVRPGGLTVRNAVADVPLSYTVPICLTRNSSKIDLSIV
jgi:hypothetical protein